MQTYNLLPTIEDLRENLILKIDENLLNKKELSEDLFTLGLNMYSENYALDSALFNAFAMSELDESICLHKEQIKILNAILLNDALIISAPTSFGKTYTVFEYIIRYKPQNIVLIVPTLALVDEYNKKIIKKYASQFSDYKVHINYDENRKYNFNDSNIFVLTHDKVVECKFYNNIEKIDLLVIDEVYKLKSDINNDRVLILNLAYKYLAEKAEKYILLAPFIKDILDKEKLSKAPVLYRSDFSPVVNKLIAINIINESEREECAIQLLNNDLKGQKNLIYFPRVNNIPKFVKNHLVKEFPIINITNSIINNFIEWAKEEIHEEWYVVKAIERGFLVHNGQLPIGVRMLQINVYEEQSQMNNMICTSTLLEGVNICAKNIIITKPRRDDDPFDAFDFYNLVGRTGRLNKHYLGCAYYIKGPNDKEYIKNDARKEIKFELTDENSKDIDICNGDYKKYPEFIEFLNELKITYDEYIENIGHKYRFDTIKKLYESYKKNKLEMFKKLNEMDLDHKIGRYYLIFPLLKILEDDIKPYNQNINSKVIAYALHNNRYSIKYIISELLKKNPDQNIDNLISIIIRMKYSFIEYDFYSKTKIIVYFMKCESVKESFIERMSKLLIEAVERLYFSDSSIKKTLKSLGIYESDINIIMKVIGEKHDNIFELKKALKENAHKFKGISFLSKYIIDSF